MLTIIEPKDHGAHQARIKSFLSLLKVYQNFSPSLEELEKATFIIASDNKRSVYGGALLCKKKAGELDEEIGSMISALQSKKRKVWSVTLFLRLDVSEPPSSLDELEFAQSFLQSLFKKLKKFGNKEKSSILVLSLHPTDFFITLIYGDWPYLLATHPKGSNDALCHAILNLKHQKPKGYLQLESSPKRESSLNSSDTINFLSQVRRDAL